MVRGRPRDANSKAAILKAAFELLDEREYAGLAFELVAKKAGVGKATIYRWWPNRAALAFDAFFDETTDDLAFPDTGSAPEDFRQQIQQLAALLRSERGAVLSALIIGARTDQELADAIGQRWVRPRQQWGIARLQQAIQDGECVEDLHILSALDALYSPLYAHLFLGIGVHSEEQVDAHCRFVFPLIFKRGL